MFRGRTELEMARGARGWLPSLPGKTLASTLITVQPKRGRAKKKERGWAVRVRVVTEGRGSFVARIIRRRG